MRRLMSLRRRIRPYSSPSDYARVNYTQDAAVGAAAGAAIGAAIGASMSADVARWTHALARALTVRAACENIGGGSRMMGRVRVILSSEDCDPEFAEGPSDQRKLGGSGGAAAADSRAKDSSTVRGVSAQ